MTLQEYLSKKNEPSTVKGYSRHINVFFTAVGEKEAEEASYQDIMNYLKELRKIHSNPRYLNTIIAALKRYYKYLIEIGVREDNPARSISLKDGGTKDIQLQDLFSPEELELLLNREERYSLLQTRNRVVISLLIYQGLHKSSISGLTLKDINLDSGEIYIKSSSNLNSRTLTLKPNQVGLFYKYLYEVRPKLLKSQTDAFVISKLGNPENGEGVHYLVSTFQGLFPTRTLTPLSIRQAVITNLLKAGTDSRLVQVFAGIKKLSSIDRYKQSGLEELQNEIERYHPLDM